MTSQILENGNLKLSIDAEDQELLRILQKEDPDNFQSDGVMYDLFERFIANSEYEWVRPEEVAALTDAPMLGIYRARQDTDGPDISVVGHWDNTDWVVSCWAFMDYQIISVQQQLLETGSAIFTNGGTA